MQYSSPKENGAKSCSILGAFCFRVGSVIALAGARDVLAICTKSGSFSKVFWTLGDGSAGVHAHVSWFGRPKPDRRH